MWHLPTLPPRLQMSGDRSSTACFPAQKQPLLRARFLVQHFRILQGMQYLQIHCSCSLSPAAGGILPQQLSVQWGTCSWYVWKHLKNDIVTEMYLQIACLDHSFVHIDEAQGLCRLPTVKYSEVITVGFSTLAVLYVQKWQLQFISSVWHYFTPDLTL